MRASRGVILAGVGLAVALTLAGASLAACDGSARHSATPSSSSAGRTVHGGSSPSGQAQPARYHPASAADTVAAESLVATIRLGRAPGSQAPGGTPSIAVPGEWLGARSVLPVIAQQPGWVEVRLAQRPNESVAWVPAADVSLATDSYHIVIDLGTMHLRLFNRGRGVDDFPAGIGVASDPTPTGSFFVASFAEAPSPGYGAFVIVTSAHSNTISDWEESGDAITAIHGPLGSDAAIGTTGAQVSHGCVRLHDADLVRLRDVPAGTPVDIVA
jgi:lipoprotein-anchoring transpeptidase ErfK/SrfK